MAAERLRSIRRCWMCRSPVESPAHCCASSQESAAEIPTLRFLSSVLPLRRVRLQNPDRLSFRPRAVASCLDPIACADAAGNAAQRKSRQSSQYAEIFSSYPYQSGSPPSTNCVPTTRTHDFHFFAARRIPLRRPFQPKARTARVVHRQQHPPFLHKALQLRQAVVPKTGPLSSVESFFQTKDSASARFVSTAKDFPKPSAVLDNRGRRSVDSDRRKQNHVYFARNPEFRNRLRASCFVRNLQRIQRQPPQPSVCVLSHVCTYAIRAPAPDAFSHWVPRQAQRPAIPILSRAFHVGAFRVANQNVRALNFAPPASERFFRGSIAASFNLYRSVRQRRLRMVVDRQKFAPSPFTPPTRGHR